jgi:hemerythrin-like domain-containing protein
MTATEDLRHEHKIILAIMDATDREARALRATGQADAATLDKIVDFCQVFIDRCHHGKEEEYLFPKMEEKGVAREQGPLGVLLGEHEAGRQRVKALAAALPQAGTGVQEAVAAVLANLEAYSALMRVHIDKENNVLFPMADRLFTQGEQQALLQAFTKHEAEEIGAGVHERYHQLAHELAHA